MLYKKQLFNKNHTRAPNRAMWRLTLPLVLLIIGTLLNTAFGVPRFPSFFGNHMVLQQQMPIRIWGWADPGEMLTVKLGPHEQQTTTDGDGRWRVVFDPLPASGSPITLSAKNNDNQGVQFSNILVGEVWVASGQSNMARQLGHENAAKALEAQIRFVLIDQCGAAFQRDDVRGSWCMVGSPETAAVSAVAYYFAKNLNEMLKAPVGIIQAAWGGTSIEPWIPREAFDPSIRELQHDYHWIEEQDIQYAQMVTKAMEAWSKWTAETMQPRPGRKYTTDYDKGMLPMLWDAQLRILKTIPNTGMAVIHNTVTDLSNIHPGNKDVVGRRMALWALAKTYGRQDVVYSGPLYKDYKVEGPAVRIVFEYAEGLKTPDGKPPSHFVIAGPDRAFVAAETAIDGQGVVVRAEQVKEPVAVRFAWENTARPNLFNGAGLPASPFRTDDWPLP